MRSKNVQTFVEGWREDGVVDGEQKLEKVLPEEILLQIPTVLGNALEKYENCVAHHDMLGRCFIIKMHLVSHTGKHVAE